MFSVIFEVLRKKERFDEYLAIAKHLKPMLETIDGFVDNERFAKDICTLRHRKIRIVRDCGMFDRREAPQFYPDVPGQEAKHARPAHPTIGN